MFSENGGRPADQRGFIHKRIIGALGGGVGALIGGGNPLAGAVRGFAGGGARRATSRTTTARPSGRGAAGKEEGRRLKFGNGNGGGGSGRGFLGVGGCPEGMEWNVLRSQCETKRRAPCDFPMVRDSTGACRTPTSGEFGGEQFGVGAAVMGRYGAALEPGSKIIDRAICLRGMQLADDGLCYNKNQITNKQRMWPAGRKPLLSGGDMRAISIAARAGRRLEGATKRLQRLGMMKKATPRRAAPHQHAKAATGVVSVP